MHHVLERQLKHVFGSIYRHPAGLEEFLKVVSETYEHFDEDRALLERVLELSSKEYRDNNKKLEEAKGNIEKLVEERMQELRSEHAKFLAIINSIPIGMILVDKDNTVTNFNHSAQTILGVKDTASALTFLDVASALSPVCDISKKCYEFREKMVTIDTHDVTFGPKSLRITLVPAASTREIASTGIVILIEDTTKRKILEEHK